VGRPPAGGARLSPQPELRTSRLLLRRWRDEDLDPFAAINADPAVLEFLGPARPRSASDAFVAETERSFEEHGFGLWAVEVPDLASCIGFIGLDRVSFDASFTPAVEIGWRLAREHWGHGYASEGARAALTFAFDTIRLDEVVSFTARSNVRSQRVMERIGMHRDPGGDFEHPRVPDGDPLRPHVLYRIRASDARPQAQA
jgi:RimJ/RimL family protein N-acetyltransferase